MKIFWVSFLLFCFQFSFGQNRGKTETFQLVALGNENNSDVRLKLLIKERGEKDFKLFRQVQAKYQKGNFNFYELSIPKNLFFEKDFCANSERTCYIEYQIGKSIFNCQVVVGHKKENAEFFLIQWGVPPSSSLRYIDNRKGPVVQPILLEGSKIWLFELSKRSIKKNHYSFIEVDLDQSKQKVLKKVTTKGPTTINYYKIVGDELFYGGINEEGEHWYDRSLLRK